MWCKNENGRVIFSESLPVYLILGQNFDNSFIHWMIITLIHFFSFLCDFTKIKMVYELLNIDELVKLLKDLTTG